MNSGIQATEGPKLPRKVDTEWKMNQNFQKEISEAVLQEPFRMSQLNQDLVHIQQMNVSMLWVTIKS